jgi:cell division protein FtsB
MATSLTSFKKNLSLAIGPTLGILACVYFAYHAIHGDRGIVSLFSLQDQVADAQRVAAEISDERDEWEHRVALMGTHQLDLDMLEERARLMLNVGYARDTVVFLHGQK